MAEGLRPRLRLRLAATIGLVGDARHWSVRAWVRTTRVVNYFFLFRLILLNFTTPSWYPRSNLYVSPPFVAFI